MDEEIGETVSRMLPDGASWALIYFLGGKGKLHAVTNIERDVFINALKSILQGAEAGTYSKHN
jgi:hypothetical protein